MSHPVSRDDIDDFVEDLISETESLAHYGVPGMKWGKRKAASIRRNSELNSASRKKDREIRKADRKKAIADNDAAIDKARANVKNGSAIKKAAKEQYKKDKLEKGSREARKVLNKTREKHYADIQKASETKSGRETTLAILSEASTMYFTGRR